MKVSMITRGLVLLIAIAGCKTKTPEQRFTDYVNDPDNKITQVIKIGETQATIKLLTQEYRNFMDSSSTGKPDTSEEKYYYFNIRFDKNVGDKLEKEKMLYLNFDMQNDFVMLRNADSVPAAICQKIENGKGGSFEYIVAFEKGTGKHQGDDFTVFYNDKIFGIGSVAFVYRKKDIEKIPALKTKSD